MGNYITSTSFGSVANVTGSSTLSGHSADNVLDYSHANRVWKATAISTGENVVLDFGSATSVAAVMLDNVNVTSVKIQGNASDSWGTPSYSDTVTVAQDAWDGRYKVYHALSSFNYRYMRIISNASSTTDGSTTLMIGTVLPITSATTWAYNAAFPYEVTPLRAVAANADFAGGGRETVSLGNRYAQIALTQPYLPTSMLSTLQTILGYGEHTPFVFCRNDSTDTAEVYVVRRVGKTTLAHAGPNHYNLANLLLEEVA